jgi:RNA polymerase sigma factor (sigma-70 family)
LGDVKVINAYLIASFRRRLLREKDKSNRLKIVSDVSDDYDSISEDTVEDVIIDDEIKADNNKRLKIHIESLSKRQREAINLRFFQKLEYPEIAQIMDISHEAAVNLVYLAIKLIRKNWTFLWIILFKNLF